MAAQLASVRTTRKQEARERILDAFIALLTEGATDLSHDAVAKRAEVARRTVYRYFPDRPALFDAALLRVRELAGARVNYPESAQELLDTLEPIYAGFDSIAPLITMLRTTPQGRQLRLAQNGQRVESYRAALADAVKELPPEDRKLATAMLQVLHTTPWLEMRDHWGLDGKQIARATGWAVRTLLKDLKERGSLPLEEDVAAKA
ncbi:MAG: helix-turn-helix transcriptional regulator [Porphyrobacter sp.]|nr:helix-turn-helix transcriptional regulator [Porphyrobacter sp.]